MNTARIFQHGGSQAVRLPKAFRFAGKAVIIEKHGEDVVLKPMPMPPLRSFTEIARYLADKYSGSEEFPEPPPRPKSHERPILEFYPDALGIGYSFLIPVPAFRCCEISPV